MHVDLTFSSFYALRDRAASIKERTDRRLSDIDRIVAQPPHTDDMVANFSGGIAAVAADFEARLASCLSDPRGDAAEVLRDGGAVYFMRDLATSKVAALVKRLCPGGDRGVKQADRLAALENAEAELRRLDTERSDILKAIGVEQARLREARQEVTWSGDGKARSAIEGVERDLAEDAAAIRRDQQDYAEHLTRAGTASG